MNMSLADFLKSRVFYRHLLVSVIITIALLFAVFQILAVYTFHGKEVTVPDYVGLTLTELRGSATYSDFDFVVVDSVYDPQKEKGTIVTQDPLPNSKVKQHRKLYLTVIASVPEKVSMPDLKDLTMRQAIATLQTYGLQIGLTEYVPDIGTNAVLKQMYKGREIRPGTMLEKGATIDLVLGQGLSGSRIHVPFLIGMTRSAALHLLSADSLYIGAEIYMDTKDTINARVYKQSPAYAPGLFLNIGQSIDIWFKTDESFDWNTYIKSFDTTGGKPVSPVKKDEF
jgi:beta-lactam-binding protein with PASTA domain